jgi:hypothetical protein
MLQMSQELDVFNGKLNGVIAALGAIAAALPQNAANDVEEVLRETIAETKGADLPAVTVESMHTTITHLIDSMQIGLQR